jgi:hypothetical protein
MSYIVGEAGKELFVSTVNGRIMPSVPTVSAAGGQQVGQQAGDNIHVSLKISTGVAQTVQPEVLGMMP